MTEPEEGAARAADLREKAEGQVREAASDGHAWSTHEDAARLVHELRVHQIELEMQNEELLRAQAKLEVSRKRYLDLYEFAPVGYVSLDETGQIVEANLTIAATLGVTREALIHVPFSRFVLAQDGDLFHKFRRHRMLEDDAAPFSCELRLATPDASILWVQLEATRTLDEIGDPAARMAITNISRRIAAELSLSVEASELKEAEGLLEDLLAQRNADLEYMGHTLESVIDVIGSVVKIRDPYTAGHQRRVAALAAAIAADMGMPDATVERIRTAGLMHDIGKVSVPAEILSKPGPLTDVETQLVRLHAEAGFRIVESAHLRGPIARIIHEHHERCDGSGYPIGLTGDDLLPESKVLMVCDVVEAMVSHRPYRAARSLDEAMAEIEGGSGTAYDPDVVASCVRVFREGGFAFPPGADGPLE
jgi:putative nucleotidyltransferase with HDIG domain/PAS domain S-box-containing protein